MTAPAKRTWTTNRVLAVAALALGLLATVGTPTRGSRVTIDTQELATIVGSTVDHVTPQELADWIVRGATDYRLIDLRSPAEFAAYHIPTAENVPIAELPDYPLGRNEKIVLYSEGGIHSAQAWFLLEAKQYKAATILFGGLEGWQDEVLNPVAPPAGAPPEDVRRFERTAQVSRFFGGTPRTAADTTGAAGRGAAAVLAPPPPAPTTQVGAPSAPLPPAGAAPARTAKKKKEGC
jgi:rhodanese-related sulfurtransferase